MNSPVIEGVRRTRGVMGAILCAGALIAVVIVAWRMHWLRDIFVRVNGAAQDAATVLQTDEERHDHGLDRSDNALTLSPQAIQNIGLSDEYIQPVQLKTFFRTITVPALVVERPGRTRLEVATPMAGVVTHVHAVQGEAVASGSLLFELRITAEELVATQTEMLRTLGELDVEAKEITRLTEVTQSGAVAQSRLLERKYAKERLEAMLAAQKEALRLQGLSDRQVAGIETDRRLLRDLRIFAPAPDQHRDDEFELTANEVRPANYLSPSDHQLQANGETQLVLQELRVHKGEIVTAGTTLAVVADLSELLVEGQAFERDASILTNASANGWKVQAIVEQSGGPPVLIPDLEMLYAANSVDVDSRTLRFYVRLPNEVLRSSPSPNGQRFLDWKYRLGQRLQLKVPVEVWENQLVLPVDAIAQEGPELFVFQRNGKQFERVPVTMAYRDQTHIVLKNDGSIFPGDQIALRGAHQMQMALKNKAGGGVDPHAGHSH